MPVDQYRTVGGVPAEQIVRTLKVTLPDRLEEFNSSFHIYKLVPPKQATVVRVESGNYFDDGVREIDFILVYDTTSSAESKSKVNTFLKNAEKQGLQFEGATGKDPETTKLLFIKAHCPEDVLLRSAIAFNIEFDSGSKNQYLKKLVQKHRLLQCARFHTHLTTRQHSSQTSNINTKERIMVIYEILKTVKYGTELSEFNVDSLVKRKYLVAAYPLHDGPVEFSKDPVNDRQLLAKYWANLSNWVKLQPIDHIHRYFGAETAFYFKLSGHYNELLIVAAVIGFFSILYGVLFFRLSIQNQYLEVCSSKVVLCPYCYSIALCHYSHLKLQCRLAAYTFIFNNTFTYVYGIFMCFWAVYFLKKWFRKETLLRFQWNLLHVEDNLDYRWEYAARTKYKRWSRITRKSEPYEPVAVIILKFLFSILIILLLLILIIITLIITIVVRQFTKYYLTPTDEHDAVVQTDQDHMIKRGFTYMLSVCFMVLLEALLFNPIIIKLTDFENPRTQQQYENSLILKQYLLYSFNAYSHVFYTAFIKGHFFQHPAAIVPEYLDLINSDRCGPLGCMVFMNFQVGVLLFFRFFFTVLFRYIIPLLKHRRKQKHLKERIKHMPPWEVGYFLQPTDRYFLMREHLELFISHGYTTLYATAFPMGSLAALLTSSLLMRLDAYMLTYVKRRPVSIKREGIHYWNGVLINRTYLAVIINAFVLAFTSDLVPELIYSKKNNKSEKIFLSYAVSHFSVEDYQPGLEHLLLKGTNSCMYHGQRYPPGHKYQYQLTGFHWYERLCRFACILVIEGCIVIFALGFTVLVPQLPRYIKEFLYEKSRRLSDQKHDQAVKVLAQS